MSKAEFGKDVRYTAATIEATAIDGNSQPGEAALYILGRNEPNPIVKRAALRVRTQELIRKNSPSRPSRP